MAFENPSQMASAVNDFRRARNQANLKEIIARFTGESVELLSYEEVRRMLRAQSSAHKGLHEVPLDAIIGSVGRYQDFTRGFLPRQDALQDRWARVELAITDSTGLPPIEVYQLGDAYFVKDGHHRVSVARRFGAKTIQAYVTEVKTKVSLSPDTNPDELILKAEYVAFLEKTQIDKLRPEADLTVTLPGQYPILEEHIAVHRYFMGLEQKREIPYPEAVAHWFDTVYKPVVEAIRAHGILRDFLERTETDLYLWIARYRAELENQLGWEIPTEEVIKKAAERIKEQGAPVILQLGNRLLNAISLGKLDSGPPPGAWRQAALSNRRAEVLFSEILVPINGRQDGWFALQQALVIAHNEGAKVHGLHVVVNRKELESAQTNDVRQEYERRCREGGIASDLVVTSGEVVPEICKRAAWTDLVIVNLSYPPGPGPLDRLSSGFHELIQKCPRPVLTVPQTATPIKRVLLAYNGSPKAKEALYVATYLADKWSLPLWVITSFDNDRIAPETLLEAKIYLEDHQIEANYLAEKGSASENIIAAAQKNDIDLIIMGGYGANPLLGVMLGSVVDSLLKETDIPLLVCR